MPTWSAMLLMRMYVFVRALLADLRLAPRWVARAQIERNVGRIEDAIRSLGASCAVTDVLDDGWMRGYINGQDVLIAAAFSLDVKDVLSKQLVQQAVKRFGLADVVVGLIVKPPSTVAIAKTVYVPRIEAGAC